MPAGSTDPTASTTAKQSRRSPGSADTAHTTDAGVSTTGSTGPTGSTSPAVAKQESTSPAVTPGPAESGVADPRIRAGTARTAGTHQPGRTAGTAGGSRGRSGRPPSSAVAEQPTARRASRPATRGTGQAVADQRAPGQLLHGCVDCSQRLLLQGVHGGTTRRGVESVCAQQ